MVDINHGGSVAISDFVRLSKPPDANSSDSFRRDWTELLASLGDRHSLTSKRSPLWNTLEACFKKGLSEAISQFDCDVSKQLFSGLDLAVPGWGHRSSKPVVIASAATPSLDDWFNESVDLQRFNPTIDCIPVRTTRKRSAKTLIEIEGLLRQWVVNLGYALRAEVYASPEAWQRQSFKYVDCIRNLLVALPCLRSRRELETLKKQSYSFCELCWKLSMRSALLASWPHEGGGLTENPFELSNRFCADHDPCRPGTKYRTDLRYREEFRRELDALKKKGCSRYTVRFTAPPGADDFEIRKTAYDLVHSGMKRNRRNDGIAIGTCEVVYIELQSGLNQSQIAKKLGISRQAVSKAAKKLKAMANRRSRLSEVDPNSAEIVRRSVH